MTKKTFDSVAWMRSRRIAIDEEDRGLSWEEKRRRTRQLIAKDPLWLKLQNRGVEPGERVTLAVREEEEKYDRKEPK